MVRVKFKYIIIKYILAVVMGLGCCGPAGPGHHGMGRGREWLGFFLLLMVMILFLLLLSSRA